MSNKMQVLRLYRHQGTWAFDDPQHKLRAEPFVLGAEDMIESMVEEYDEYLNEVTLVFSDSEFPGARWFRLEYEQFGGAWYTDEKGNQGWLCPAMFCYFPEGPPARLWAEVQSPYLGEA